MKKFTFLLAMMLVTFTACHNEDFEEISLESKREKISYEVTPEEAVSRLGMFLSNNGTRASLNDVTIKTLMKSDFVPTTRSSDAEDAPAVYLIDIPDGGCAVMGADKRLEPVYAIMDETKLSPEDLVVASTRTESTEDEDIQTFVTGLINDAVEADLMGLVPFPKDSLFIPDPTEKLRVWDDTVIVQQVPPLLDTKYSQHSPYNNNYPVYNNITGERKYAGCGPIAAAQIMYYHRKPNTLNGVTFNWNLLSYFHHGVYNNFPDAQNAMAEFIITLTNASGVNLFSNINQGIETFLTENEIKTLFQNSGYTNLMFTAYNLNRVETYLDSNKPVFMSARNSQDTGGHMWVIDGCYLYKIDHWVRESYYVGPGWDYNEYINDTDYYYLVHCNYGWAGECDGYYNSGIFDTTVELPDGYIDTTIGDREGGARDYYNREMKLLLYNK